VRTFGPQRDRIPLILIHGFLDSTATWDLVAEGIAGERKVLLMDLLGHGYTERPRDKGYTVEDLLAQIASLQNALNMEKIHIGGNSLGGILSVLFALKSQERVASVTVVDGGVGGKVPGVPFFVLRLLTSAPLLRSVRQVLRPVEKSLFAWLFREWVLGSGRPSEERIKSFLEPTRFPGALEGFGRLTRGYVSYFGKQEDRLIKEDLASMRMPTLLIWGERDRIVSPRVAEALHKGIPHSRKVILAGCGHCPQLEAPENFVRAVREFLAPMDQRYIASPGQVNS